MIIMFYVQNISIYINFGGSRGELHGPPYIFRLLFKNTKQYNTTPCTKIKFCIILSEFFFLRWIIKQLRKGGPKIIRKGGERGGCNWAKWAGVAPCDTPTMCGQSPCLWSRGDSVPERFFYHSFPNIYHFILQIDNSPWVFIIERSNKLHYV